MKASRLSALSRPNGPRRTLSAAAGSSAIRNLLQVSSEVSDAIAKNKPVVALESTIYTHGALGKGLAREHEDLVRSTGGIPAIIAIVDGVPKVGVSTDEIVRMIEEEGTVKASRRDISYLVGMGLAGRKIHGGTTIAGTMLLARLAGIRVFGTGGLGGVHRGGESSMDISADLTELGRTRVAVISSGCKGFLDIPRTLEYLETQGCLVSTFADGRTGEIDFPAFWARDSGVKSPSVTYTEREAAAMILAQEKLGIESGMLFANPIPEEFGVPAKEMQAHIELAVAEAGQKGFTGSANTPYVLQRLKELTGEKAVIANKALVRSNIVRATNVAVELSRLLSQETSSSSSSNKVAFASKIEKKPPAPLRADSKADILVAGSVAVDLSCDYSSPKGGDGQPHAHTSNPASISQSIGGVGHNVALAAHRASRQAQVKLSSMVGDDIAGATVLSALEASGLDSAYVKKLDRTEHPGSRTAQYVAINDGSKNLVMAMADMGIFTQHLFPEDWKSTIKATDPKWLVVDGNWSPKGIRSWIHSANEHGSKVAFEPVSVEKSKSLFGPQRGVPTLGVFPNQSIDLSSPNVYELSAMYSAAKDNGYLDSPDWFEVIDSFGMRGARDRFVRLTSAELTDAGVPVQSIQLLPYIPTLTTKLGSKGVLLTTILGKDDPRLRDRESDEFILTRSLDGNPAIGGIYMRLFPPVEKVESIVSVNGVGDTFLGVMISGLAQGGRVDKLIDLAQRGAVYSLKCAESVSKDVSKLEGELQTPQEPAFSEDLPSESSFSSDIDSDDASSKKKPAIALQDKDSDEEDLERLVFGSKVSFGDSLFKNNGLFGASDEKEGKQLELADADTGGLEDVDDVDLFMIDTAPSGAAPQVPATAAAKKAEGGDPAAWQDSDDDRLGISLATHTRLRKLRLTEAEDVVSGTEYSRRLRQRYLQLHPAPAWAKEAEGRPAKRRRRLSASSGSSDGSGSEADGEVSAQPLEEFLRDVNSLSGAGGPKKRRLRPEVIDIQRTREISDKHLAPVECLSFHPEYPVLLSASTASVLYLHHIAPDAHPVPNPRLTSVQVKGVDIRRAEFLYPDGDKVFIGGRRKYFHHWDLKSGIVQKTSQIQGHRLEHKTMERFKLSPCGRYMAITASTRKGGGVVNILSVGSLQWIAAARLSSRNGIADLAWWSTGDGMTILGRDGQVGEYSVESKSFIGLWRDDGCIGGMVIALGGHQGPALIGDDRWVAIGSNSGITNIYDRSELLTMDSEKNLVIKETPSPARVFEQLVTPITVLTFSPDGQLLAFGSREKKDALKLAHLPSCTVYRNWPTAQTPLGRITTVAFGRESSLLAVGNDAGKIRLWEIRS
ncbi:Indigoidine synthase A like domain-containing protein [Trichoderma ceciliae]